MAYFTTYWKNDTWMRKAREASVGRSTIEYAASGQFKEAGVVPGSTVIVITVLKGILHVAGVVKVDRLLSSRGAASLALGVPESELWDGDYFVLPKAGSADLFRDGVMLPPSVAATLQFESRAGVSHPKVQANGKLDQQTLRNVRRLAPGSARHLLAAVGL